ncbi:hypothetical protein B0T18DRAFT_408634 [Schizothecium vesticola]|uniref:BTB domain-containing protein n=1 Tax=Schizothecium vesticola TaxID=314040 RepID=A0AA40K9E7_9PEZI|nr:hypothetical protein B0T18DRAFT_408634 [Schizothecium vesticola]
MFEESKTGVVEIRSFGPEAVDWVIRYINTGTCDIPSLRPAVKTNFITCYEVYTVADFFALDSLTTPRPRHPQRRVRRPPRPPSATLRPLPAQVPRRPAPPIPGPLARRLLRGRPPCVPGHARFGHGHHAHPHRRHQLYPPRFFFFLQNAEFNAFLDSPAAPAFALDMFRIMRGAGDFVAALPETICTLCRNKPGRSDKAYYTHVAPERLRLAAACSTCAVKRHLGNCTGNWLGKREERGGRLVCVCHD